MLKRKYATRDNVRAFLQDAPVNLLDYTVSQPREIYRMYCNSTDIFLEIIERSKQCILG